MTYANSRAARKRPMLNSRKQQISSQQDSTHAQPTQTSLLRVAFQDSMMTIELLVVLLYRPILFHGLFSCTSKRTVAGLASAQALFFPSTGSSLRLIAAEAFE